MDRFPSLRWPELRRILERAPLGYAVTRRSGSHRTLEAHGRPTLHLSFHDRQELPAGLIRDILVTQIGLSEETARHLVRPSKGNET